VGGRCEGGRPWQPGRTGGQTKRFRRRSAILKMSTRSPIERLCQLVRMLSSDRDGEVLSAVHAINRTLKSSGLDIHYLADGIGHSTLSEGQERSIFHRGFEAGFKAAKTTNKTNGASERAEPSWHAIAYACRDHPEILHSDREREFVGHMIRATVRGGKLSEKQASWLRKIYARVP
jgi:hypothetical protein